MVIIEEGVITSKVMTLVRWEDPPDQRERLWVRNPESEGLYSSDSCLLRGDSEDRRQGNEPLARPHQGSSAEAQMAGSIPAVAQNMFAVYIWRQTYIQERKSEEKDNILRG